MKTHHLIQGLRLACGFVIALGITTAINYPDASWVIISIVVVLSTSHEQRAVMMKALQRVAGTLSGLILGMVGLWLAQFSMALLLAYMFIVILVVGSLMHGRFAYIAIVAGITLAVISAHVNDWHAGLWRAMNVSIGAMVGSLIALAIPYPSEVK
ncbi:hypothetical protein EJE24_06355 [Enterobacter huaxiensis]|uniref:Integral membrane bound transporter domain-containing protein n=1 Tax=Enterobacter huaxiensis TaxID=2494702 RepID=A0A428LVI8_9ENTR|nr:FUSC family protein [Enterobacter huaxiensis]RSK69412.1 hypothetical protein EJE24_06355 [Enterobacter huaxiensis]